MVASDLKRCLGLAQRGHFNFYGILNSNEAFLRYQCQHSLTNDNLRMETKLQKKAPGTDYCERSWWSLSPLEFPSAEGCWFDAASKSITQMLETFDCCFPEEKKHCCEMTKK